jgi:integrase
MPEKVHLTKRIIENLQPSTDKKPRYIYDLSISGLILIISPNNKKIFKVRKSINGKTQSVYLGEYPIMSPVEARELSLLVLGELMKTKRKHPVLVSALGSTPNPVPSPIPNPVPSPIPSHLPTLNKVFRDYLAKRRKLKPVTIADYERCLRVAFPDWLHLTVDQITETMVINRHAKRSSESKARADNEFRVLRGLFNFASQEYKSTGYNLDNPVETLNHNHSWNKVGRKQTYLNDSDLKAWFEAVNTLPYWYSGELANTARVYFLLTLFNGYRRTECSLLRWHHIDFDRETITLEVTKNNKRHTLPLTPFTKTLLQTWLKQSPNSAGDGLIFSAATNELEPIEYIEQVIKAIIKRCGVKWSMHDLRRTFSTVAHSGGMDAYTLKRLLNHSDGSDVTAGYLISDLPLKKEALEWIHESLLVRVQPSLS